MRKRFFINSFINLLLVMIIPITLLGTLMIIYTNRYLKEDITSKNQALLKQSSQITRLIFQSFDTVNLMISSDSTSARALRRITSGSELFSDEDIKILNNLNNSINSIIASNHYIDSVYVFINGTDKFYSSSDRIVPIEKLEDSKWIEDLSSGLETQGFTFRQLHSNISNDHDKDIVSVYRRMFSGAGTVVVNIDIDKLRDDMEKYLVYEDQVMYLTDSVSSINLTGETSIEWDSMSEILADNQDEFTQSIEDKPYLISRLPIDKYDWYFVSLAPLSTLYKLQYNQVQLTLMAITICVLIGIVVAALSARKNYKSICGIINAIETAHKGGELLPPQKSQDVYTYIIHNFIHHGILKDYVDVQLSEKKYMMQTLEMKALQYQINPHFLVNTLKGIYWKSVKANGISSPAARMTENLLDITGYYLSDPSATVTLREEILHTKSYTDILTDRHEGELEVSWDYAQEMEDVVCKRLILQPFIENAFYHGIRPASEEIKKYNSKGRIRIKIRQKAEEIIINITDNGKGMPKNKLNAIRSSLSKTEMPTEHIGIYNPHRRIVLTFGEKYGVNVYSLMNCGTTVQIRLPKFTF